MENDEKYASLTRNKVFGHLPEEAHANMRKMLSSGIIKHMASDDAQISLRGLTLGSDALKHDAAIDKDLDARGRLDDGKPTEIVRSIDTIAEELRKLSGDPD